MPPNPQNLKPFKKGDPRINRKGRPKNFNQLRELAQLISTGVALDKNGNEIVVPGINDRITTVQAILLQMSRDPKRQKDFLEIAYGKVPDEIVLGNKDGERLEIGVTTVDYRSGIAPLAPRPIRDSDAPGKNESTGDGETLGQNGAGRGADDDST